jgi:hypothetical protein
MKRIETTRVPALSARVSVLAALLLGYACLGCGDPSAPEIEGKYRGTWKGVLTDSNTVDIEPCDLEVDIRYDSGSDLGLEGSSSMALGCLQAASGVVLDERIEVNMTGVTDYDGNVVISADNCSSVPCFSNMYISGQVEDGVLSGNIGFNLDTGGDFLSVDGRVSLKAQ